MIFDEFADVKTSRAMISFLRSFAPIDCYQRRRHSREMSAGRTIGFVFLGLLLGGVVGGGLGLLGGLGYTEIASTSGFEGYSGFVVAYWILGGIFFGMIAGLVAGLKRSGR